MRKWCEWQSSWQWHNIGTCAAQVQNATAPDVNTEADLEILRKLVAADVQKKEEL